MSCKETIAVSVAGFSLGSIGTHGGVSSRDVPLAFIGPRIKEGEFVQDTIPGIEDIVPTLLNLWGEPIPSYIDGRVLNEIIE